MPKFREITGQFVGYIPDSIDADIVPDRAPMDGRVTFTPVFTGGVIAFPELSPPEFAHPRTIHAKIVDGFVQVEVNEGEGEDEQIVLQPLSLMVTVDDEASQVWSWRADFDEILIGASDEYVKIPAWSFRVPDGVGPVDLTELVPLKTGGSVDVTKGPRGAGLQNITAIDGQLVFAYSDGQETTVPIPEAVQGPQGEPGPAGADGAQGPEGPQGPAGEIPDLLVSNISDATPTGKNLMLAATEGAARSALGLAAGATASNGSPEELNAGTSSTPRVWTANNIASHVQDNYVRSYGTRGTTRTIYVRADGSDSNTGSSTANAFREIRAAVDSLDREMPDLRGSVVIDVGPGIYKGGIRLPNTRTPAQDNFLTIKGPGVGGHPNAPTAVIRYDADTSATWGVLAENGWWLWVEDIKIVGAFNSGLDCRSDVTLQRRNVHIDGCSIGVNVTTRVMDNSRGGIVENCALYGVQEMYHVVRTYPTGAGQGTIYRNNKYGIYSKAHCVGHMDYAVFQNNQVAIHLDRSSANVGGVSISGATVCGISLKDSEVHGGVSWGTGNTRRVLSYGPGSSDSGIYGWGNDPQATLRTGITQPILIGQTYPGTVVTGTTSVTNVAQFIGLLKADRYAVKGQKLRVRVSGSLNSTLAGTATVRISVGSSSVLAVVVPTGLTGGSFLADVEMVCTADGNNQLWSGFHMTQNGSYRAYHSLANRDMTGADRTVDVTVQMSDPTDSMTIYSVEVHG